MIFASKSYPFVPFSQLRYQNSCPFHTHDFFEISLVLSGSNINRIGETDYVQTPGDVSFLRPGESHELKALTPEVPADVYSHQDFYVPTDYMQKLCEVISDTLYEELLHSQTPIRLTLDQRQFELLNEKISLYNYLITRSDSSYCRALSKSMVYLLLDAFLKRQYDQSNPQPLWLQNFIQRLQQPDNLCKPINELCKFSNYSHGYLCLLFKKHMNVTLEKYVIRLKIQYAAKLLQDTQMSVAQIAGLAGYLNQCNFIKQFKNYYQCSPTKWRQLHNKTK